MGTDKEICRQMKAYGYNLTVKRMEESVWRFIDASKMKDAALLILELESAKDLYNDRFYKPKPEIVRTSDCSNLGMWLDSIGAGMTQQEFSTKLGLAGSTLYRYRRTNVIALPPAGRVKLEEGLARFLNKPIEEIKEIMNGLDYGNIDKGFGVTDDRSSIIYQGQHIPLIPLKKYLQLIERVGI